LARVRPEESVRSRLCRVSTLNVVAKSSSLLESCLGGKRAGRPVVEPRQSRIRFGKVTRVRAPFARQATVHTPSSMSTRDTSNFYNAHGPHEFRPWLPLPTRPLRTRLLLTPPPSLPSCPLPRYRTIPTRAACGWPQAGPVSGRARLAPHRESGVQRAHRGLRVHGCRVEDRRGTFPALRLLAEKVSDPHLKAQKGARRTVKGPPV